MNSSWRGNKGKGKPGTVWFGPKALIIPLYHKIRIRFDKILHWVLGWDAGYRRLAKSKSLAMPLEWDIYLTTEGEVKRDIRTAAKLDADKRWRLLERPLPRFVWRATAFVGDSRFIDFLFDATDIDQGDLLLDGLIYSP